MKLSVEEFKKILTEATKQLALDKGWKWELETGRGFSFQLWAAYLIAASDQNYETDPEDSLLLSGDLKADFVLEDSVNRRLLICQCKFSSLSKLVSINEDEVASFFNRHRLFVDRAWVEKHGSAQASDLLGDYSEKIEASYTVVYRFLSTGKKSERILELVETFNKQYASQDESILCELWDFSDLKDYYVTAQSIEESVPSTVEIQLPRDSYFIVDKPYRTIAVALKGNALRDLYKRYKEALFSYNIRSYLGNRGINAIVKATADKYPEKFYYFNNGISGICTSFDVIDGQLIADNLQIINGAQTIGTLAKSVANTEIMVLFRLTEAESVKTEKGFNEEIIRYNNTQNVIKVSDFRANDAIQLWLERRFREQKATANLPKLRYVRKRAFKRIAGEQPLKLEGKGQGGRE